MPGPARAGAVVYAKDLHAVARFYRELLRARTLHEDSDHVVLQSPDIQLVVHAIPAPIAQSIIIKSPPEPREEQAVKLFFTVPSLAWARSTARAAGGEVDGRVWEGPGFLACNGTDPEGNVVQVREARRAA